MGMEDLNGLRDNFKNEDRYEFEGVPVPRTTEILSKCIHDDRIVYWANSLGFKRKGYRKTLNEAAAYGTFAHSHIEHYLKNGDIPECLNWSFEAFLNWWGQVNAGNKVEVVGQEEKMSCPWFGGTYDMLMRVNGKLMLVDFKTSNHLSFKYCLQLAAYNFMLKYNKREAPSGFLVLQLSKESDEFNEMLLNMENPEHARFMDFCEQTFLSLVRSFYYITQVEKMYKKIEGE